MNGTILKDPHSELKFCFDWRLGYLTKNENLRDDLGWTVQPVDGNPACLCIVEQTHGRHCSNVVLTGGVPGQTYLLTATVRTDKGRVLTRAVALHIIQNSGDIDETI